MLRTVRLFAVCLFPVAADAQAFAFKPGLQAGWRADALFGSPAGAEIAADANVPVGYYLRLGLTAGAGVARHDDGIVSSGRIDLSGRYLLDPFREFRWGPYVGAGLTSRWANGAGWRTNLLALVGVEGPESRGWRTAVEAGAGGGLRLGVVFRRARQNGR